MPASGQPEAGIRMPKWQLGCANALSSVGERLGIGWLTYNPLQMVVYHRYAVRDAPGVVGSFEKLFPDAHAYVDVGCGSGAYAAEAVRRGHPTVGLERSRVGRLLSRRQGVDCKPFDLQRRAVGRGTTTADLAYCLEVAEHVPAAWADVLVEVLCRLSPIVVFSAAPPGQGGVGHINEQPPDYWHARFAARNFHHDVSASHTIRESFDRQGVWAPWLKKNTVVYDGAD